MFSQTVGCLLKAFILNIGIFQVGSVFSQTCIIEGVIREQTGAPIEYASVALLTISDSVPVTGAITDSMGCYTFTNDAPGEYYLKVSYIGYKGQFINKLQITPGYNPIDTVSLNFTSYNLDEVTIKAKGTDNVVQLDGSSFMVNESMILKAKDLRRLLNFVPSVSVDKNYNISVNGKDKVVLMINNIEQIDNRLINEIKPDDVEKIDVITNPNPSYTAVGYTAIINVITKDHLRSGYMINPCLDRTITQKMDDSYLIASYRMKKIHVFMSYNRFYRKYEEKANYERFYKDGLGIEQFSTLNDPSIYENHKLFLGTDFKLKSNHTIGVKSSLSRYTEDKDFYTLNQQGVIPSTPEMVFCEYFSSGTIKGNYYYENAEQGDYLSMEVEYYKANVTDKYFENENLTDKILDKNLFYLNNSFNKKLNYFSIQGGFKLTYIEQYNKGSSLTWR